MIGLEAKDESSVEKRVTGSHTLVQIRNPSSFSSSMSNLPNLDLVTKSELQQIIDSTDPNRSFQDWMVLKSTQKQTVFRTAPNPSQILTNLCIVFTGELKAYTREQAQCLVRYLGGRTTQVPSGLTDFVVMGTHPGPSKLKRAQKYKTKVIREDEFHKLVQTKIPVILNTVSILPHNLPLGFDGPNPTKDNVLASIQSILYTRIISIVCNSDQDNGKIYELDKETRLVNIVD